MVVLTDGEIAKESEEKIENIDEYYFGKQKYTMIVYLPSHYNTIIP